ncbi:MAG: RnfABCDGE type electron transport complex subunit G [Desulfuromonadales bacterium]|nr:RnfABCDGE type electron transport complex subunit G [Desulfuromonadales bacterium]
MSHPRADRRTAPSRNFARLQAVMPPSDNAPDEDTVQLVTGQDKRGRDLSRTFFRGRLDGELSGIAFKVVAPDGYSGDIVIMVGIDPEGTVSGIEILTHAETPGLGDKIELPEYKAGFNGKNLDNADWRVQKDGGEFDQITGATISPRAIVGAVKNGLEFYRDNLQVITADKRAANTEAAAPVQNPAPVQEGKGGQSK